MIPFQCWRDLFLWTLKRFVLFIPRIWNTILLLLVLSVYHKASILWSRSPDRNCFMRNKYDVSLCLRQSFWSQPMGEMAAHQCYTKACINLITMVCCWGIDAEVSLETTQTTLINGRQLSWRARRRLSICAQSNVPTWWKCKNVLPPKRTLLTHDHDESSRWP